MNITYTEIIILIIKTYFSKLINWLYILILKYISDKYLIFVSNKIKYDVCYDTSESDDEIELKYNYEYELIKKTFKINKIIDKYEKNRYINYNKKDFYIIKSFLFNYDSGKDINKYICTKKIIIIINLFEKLTTDKIKDITNKYKYIYIFYKNDLNEFNVKVIDIVNNIDIYSNSELIFNIITL